MKLYNNRPSLITVFGVTLQPGPQGNEVAAEDWRAIMADPKKRAQYAKLVKSGDVSAEAYTPRSEKRPRSRPGGNTIDAEGPSRRAVEPMLTPGVPDRALLDELTGRIDEQAAAIDARDAKIAALEAQIAAMSAAATSSAASPTPDPALTAADPGPEVTSGTSAAPAEASSGRRGSKK